MYYCTGLINQVSGYSSHGPLRPSRHDLCMCAIWQKYGLSVLYLGAFLIIWFKNEEQVMRRATSIKVMKPRSSSPQNSFSVPFSYRSNHSLLAV